MSYLQNWNGTWRVRYPVLKPVRPVLKRERLIQFLGTKCKDEAMRLAALTTFIRITQILFGGDNPHVPMGNLKSC